MIDVIRTPARHQGRVAVTPGMLRKALGASGGVTVSYPSVSKQTFEFEPSDYTADGSLYYVELTHSLRTLSYSIDVVDSVTGDDLFAERINRKPSGDTDKLRLWFAHTPYITVTVIG